MFVFCCQLHVRGRGSQHILMRRNSRTISLVSAANGLLLPSGNISVRITQACIQTSFTRTASTLLKGFFESPLIVFSLSLTCSAPWNQLCNLSAGQERPVVTRNTWSLQQNQRLSGFALHPGASRRACGNTDEWSWRSSYSTNARLNGDRSSLWHHKCSLKWGRPL